MLCYYVDQDDILPHLSNDSNVIQANLPQNSLISIRSRFPQILQHLLSLMNQHIHSSLRSPIVPMNLQMIAQCKNPHRHDANYN